MKKVLFITGTRADYGKIKPLINALETSENFKVYIFVSGMHLIEKLGSTYREILKDKYENVYVDFSQVNVGIASYDLGNIICNLTSYVKQISPDMIAVHGDRIDALAGAAVGALNNIRVAHIEGGELSGTIDESIRHAVSKFAHIHFVCNDDAKKRLIQLGENDNRIFIIGSPDIDMMLSGNLPTLDQARERYEIYYEKYRILMYHPVTTEYQKIRKNIREIVDAVLESGEDYVVIYPNNDLGSEIILQEYERFADNEHFRVFPSLRFEYFLTLLKNAEVMLGNSSAGVRETSVYGIPAIDIGTRQEGRYDRSSQNIQHVDERKDEILHACSRYKEFKKQSMKFGTGESTKRFMEIMNEESTWTIDIQKRFVDIN